MTEIGFYQLRNRPAAAVLPRLLDKALAAGFRVVVRCADDAQAETLDAALWTYDEGSFLPHGLATAGDAAWAAAQPVLLTTDATVLNAADLLALPSGVLSDDVAAFRRVLYLFDGTDEATLAMARAEWKRAAAMPDVTPVYWREGERGWEKAG